MSFLTDVVTTLAKPVNTLATNTLGINAMPDVKPEEALIYTDCIGGANVSINHVALGVGEYDAAALEKLGLNNKVVGIRPGKNVQVTVFNPPNTPFVVGANIGDQCLPDIWRNQAKALKIEKVASVSHTTKEGFGGDMLFTLINVLLVLLILFIVYKLVA